MMTFDVDLGICKVCAIFIFVTNFLLLKKPGCTSFVYGKMRPMQWQSELVPAAPAFWLSPH